MLLCFDIDREAIAEHDEWHSHEHLPERTSIPGFLRGTRWVAVRGEPRYFVLYEVAEVATLTSGAYLERLNHPTPWTQKMMRHYRGMSRGLCSVRASFGFGLGHFGRLLRFSPKDAPAGLLESLLRELPSKPGICSAHLFERAATAAMTNEQRIRGADAGVDAAILVSGYDEPALAELEYLAAELARLSDSIRDATYRVAHSLSAREL